MNSFEIVQAIYLEPSFANKLQQGLFHSVEQVLDQFTIIFIQCFGQSVKPGHQQRLPTQHMRLHVNHATATHLRKSASEKKS